MRRRGVRPAVSDDLVSLRDIEVAAGQRFRDFGLAHVADDEPFSIEALAAYADDGRAWVAVDEADQPVGYIVVDVVDGGAHIEQVTVTPRYQGQGIGRALIEQVRVWAASRGLAAVTLTTFDRIPWNRPLYEHLGFGVVAADDIGPELLRLREAEAHHGLDPELRVVMRLEV